MSPPCIRIEASASGGMVKPPRGLLARGLLGVYDWGEDAGDGRVRAERGVESGAWEEGEAGLRCCGSGDAARDDMMSGVAGLEEL
jgi:hypothetical protein